MRGDIWINPDSFRRRWVCYIDLLGFTRLVETKSWELVFSAYSQALETLKNHSSYENRTQYTWFSDTFIFYTKDDQSECYLSIEQFMRHFVYFLIMDEIPLRGSIAAGEFYAEEENNIFFGKALIEAYRYGEAQDWIGLVQCPSAIDKLLEYKLDITTRLNYPIWKIPYKKENTILQTELPAYRIGEHLKINGKNQCLAKLKEMSLRDENQIARKKYERTIDFIEKNQLITP